MIVHGFGARQLSPAAYYTITYVSLLVIYLLAVSIQSAYSVRFCAAVLDAARGRWRAARAEEALPVPSAGRSVSWGRSVHQALCRCPQVVGLVGATTGTTMAFIFPGMLALRDPQGGRAYRAFGWALLASGALLCAIGLAAPA